MLPREIYQTYESSFSNQSSYVHYSWQQVSFFLVKADSLKKNLD